MATPLEIASRYAVAGFSVIRVKKDGSKKPFEAWKEYQDRKPTEAELQLWFGGRGHYGFALIHGKVSGSSEVLDFDAIGAFEEFAVLCADHSMENLLSRLVRIETPSGGVHLLWRCQHGIEGNQKLARCADGTVKIETRGEGGYTLAPGSPKECHPSGKEYFLRSGKLSEIPAITAEERTGLLAMARACNEYADPERVCIPSSPGRTKAEGDSGLSPGTDYNNRAGGDAVLAILERHGWSVDSQRGEVVFLRRPGKSRDMSATLNYCGPGVFYCFTTSTPPFDVDRCYPPFSVYGLLEHGGDFVAAARDLGIRGYGEPATARSAPRTIDRTEARGSEAAPAADETLPPYPPGGYNLTDLGNAERLVHRHGRDFRYNKAFGWMAYTGKVWQADDSGEIKRRMKETVRYIHNEAADVYRQAAQLEKRKESLAREIAALPSGDDPRAKPLQAQVEGIEKESGRSAARAKELSAWAYKSEAAARIEAAISLSQTEAGIYADPSGFDSDPYLLNCQNGVVDLKAGSLRPHDREAYCTKICAVEYDPEAAAPLWESCMARWQPDDEVRSFLQRAAGYSLTGHTGEETAFLLYGLGRNGKSKFTGALSYIMGDYAGRAPIEIFMQSRGGPSNGPTPDKANLAGKRMIVASEIMQSGRFNEAFVKDVTGGDEITAAKKFRDPFTFKPSLKLWFYGNHKPEIAGTDDGIKARLPLIPFTVTIPAEERDPDLDSKLQAEGPGILAWAVRGCIDWQKQRLAPPKAIIRASEAYHADMDVLASFFKARCIFGPLEGSEVWTATADLRDTLKEWARGEGVDEKELPKPNEFADRLRREGCGDNGGKTKKLKGRAARCWSNIRLRTDEDPEEEGDFAENRPKGNTVTPGNANIEVVSKSNFDFPIGKEPENSVTGVTVLPFSSKFSVTEEDEEDEI